MQYVISPGHQFEFWEVGIESEGDDEWSFEAYFHGQWKTFGRLPTEVQTFIYTHNLFLLSDMNLLKSLLIAENDYTGWPIENFTWGFLANILL